MLPYLAVIQQDLTQLILRVGVIRMRGDHLPEKSAIASSRLCLLQINKAQIVFGFGDRSGFSASSSLNSSVASGHCSQLKYAWPA